MAKRIFALGILVLGMGAQIPVFAISERVESEGCGLLTGSVKIPEYQATHKERQKHVRLRLYADRQHAYTGETADLMKRCGDTPLATTAISGTDFVEVIRMF